MAVGFWVDGRYSGPTHCEGAICGESGDILEQIQTEWRNNGFNVISMYHAASMKSSPKAFLPLTFEVTSDIG